jgi:HNH endonuclease
MQIRAAILASAGLFLCAASPDGMVRPITKQEVCSTHWGRDARHVTAAMKRQVFRDAGYPLGNKDPRCACEVDHIVPRSIGGADDVSNLQIQQYFGPWNAHMKDRLEVLAHKDVCAGSLSIHDAQQWFLGDWKAEYIKHYGVPNSARRPVSQ